ncbi:hypothetical protein [Microbacterium sp. SLBN-146]|uniref:hypothetical protein n=1 Tax=Microbacterium sp. SLBN-146 TaxID=2768457 RepID=UPI0011539168|nr:hypothetical protein [Microbacterium sp. SLBN-146]
MSASPSSTSATVPSLGVEKNLFLIDTGAESSCCGGGSCGTGIDSSADGSVDSAAAESASRSSDAG